MKRLVALLLTLVMGFSLVACADSEEKQATRKHTDKLTEIEKQEVLVASYDDKIDAASADYQELTRLLGEKEEAEGLVSVRSRFAGDEGQKTIEAFVDQICKEIRTKEIRQEVVQEEK